MLRQAAISDNFKRAVVAVNSGEKFFYNRACHNRGPLEATVVEIGEINMVQTHQVKNCSVDIVNVRRTVDRAQTKFIGAADGLPGLYAAAREPGREAPRVVVPSFAFFVKRGTPELATPDDERIVQQSARFQVRQ